MDFVDIGDDLGEVGEAVQDCIGSADWSPQNSEDFEVAEKDSAGNSVAFEDGFDEFAAEEQEDDQFVVCYEHKPDEDPCILNLEEQEHEMLDSDLRTNLVVQTDYKVVVDVDG